MRTRRRMVIITIRFTVAFMLDKVSVSVLSAAAADGISSTHESDLRTLHRTFYPRTTFAGLSGF